MITFLAAIYEFERANLLERQRDGIAVAKMQGKYKGRKQVAKPANFDDIYRKSGQNVKLNHYIAVFERIVLLCKICEQQTSNRIESLAIESGCIRG